MTTGPERLRRRDLRTRPGNAPGGETAGPADPGPGPASAPAAEPAASEVPAAAAPAPVPSPEAPSARPADAPPLADAPPPADAPLPAGAPHPSADAPDDGLLPPEVHRYTARHYLTLVAVAVALGFLIWSLTAHAGRPGAAGAAPADTTTSLSAPPAAHRGEP